MPMVFTIFSVAYFSIILNEIVSFASDKITEAEQGLLIKEVSDARMEFGNSRTACADADICYLVHRLFDKRYAKFDKIIRLIEKREEAEKK